MTDSNSVANAALQLIGDNMPPVQGFAPTFDNSTAGIALQKLYSFCVNTVARQFGWDFARNVVALALSGNVAPMGWGFEYVYPSSGVEVWQLTPPFPLTDPNNPLPVHWDVGNAIVAGTQTKVIWADQATASAVYNNAPSESTWDPLFREAVERLLASEVSMALFGRPDSAEAYLNSGAAMEQIGESRVD
jgi:hypothetical protein